MKSLFYLSTILFLFVSFRIDAQVTIGVDEEAVHGALLQLKDQKKVVGGEANATKGLLLPRVQLTELTSLNDINPESTERPDPVLHTGLTVYNMNNEDCNFVNPIRKGVHIWDGMVWNPMQPIYNSVVETYQDQDGNEFRARTFGTAGTWMIENLRVTKLADNLGGTPLTESVGGMANIQFAYTYPGLNKSYFESNPLMGLLYDWDAATNRKALAIDEADVENSVEKSKHKAGVHMQGICPEGWHIPTAAEWIELEKEIIKNASEYSSLSSLSEPSLGLDPANPFEGTVNSGGGTYKRGNHGVAMTSGCNLPGITGANVSKGNSYYDGGLSVMMAGSVWYLTTLRHNYGAEAYFHTGSLYRYVSGDVLVRFIGVSFYPSETENAEFSARSSDTSNNGGYLSVRCKKD